ncbi:MAG: helix-turn-helix domain-containing protein, partial [Gemmatimonadales bacterium]
LIELADETDGKTITRKVTHHTIAQMIGSSRETVSRTMRDLADKGLIAVEKRAITIQNRPALMEAAGLRG